MTECNGYFDLSDDFLLHLDPQRQNTQPSSIILEDDAEQQQQLSKVDEEINSPNIESDVDSEQSEAARTTSSVVREHEVALGNLADAVPDFSHLPEMTILEWVDKVTVMRPRNVHGPREALLKNVYLTHLGYFYEGSLRRVCPGCSHSCRANSNAAFPNSTESSAEGQRCYACKREYEEFGISGEFNVAVADASGELYGIRVNGFVAMHLLNCPRLPFWDERGIKRALLFSQWNVRVRACWNESLRRPIVDFVEMQLARDE